MKKIILKRNGEIVDEIMLPQHDELTICECAEEESALPKCDYVDLGLPSGILWATYNIGAAVPGDCGDYYAWGELTPRDYEDWVSYEEITYKLRNVKCYTDDDKYKRTLLPEYDVATQKLGEKWRYPTDDEFRELSQCCVWKQDTEINSQGEEIKGYRVTSKINGNSIFLPAAGYRWGTELTGFNESGNYFSGNLGYRTWYGQYESRSSEAFYLYLNCDENQEKHSIDRIDRCYGLPIRPVRIPE